MPHADAFSRRYYVSIFRRLLLRFATRHADALPRHFVDARAISCCPMPAPLLLAMIYYCCRFAD